MLAYANFAPAYVDIRVAERCQNLGYGDAVGFQFVRVHFDLELFGGTSPTVDRRNAGYGQQPARDDPVLNGTQVRDSKMRRADYLIAVDFPG